MKSSNNDNKIKQMQSDPEQKQQPHQQANMSEKSKKFSETIKCCNNSLNSIKIPVKQTAMNASSHQRVCKNIMVVCGVFFLRILLKIIFEYHMHSGI